MNDAPDFLKDSATLLSSQGFKTSNVWYHGTASGLKDSILEKGLVRSGDSDSQEANKKTMATIGNSYHQSVEPIFLSQCKEVAYYWAEQTCKRRNMRFQNKETPLVFSVTLPNELNINVKPDVGAASLLLLGEGEHFLSKISSMYERSAIKAPIINLASADRMDYLNKLGLAYYDNDIDVGHVQLLYG